MTISSSTRKRESDVPVEQADAERRQQLYREEGSAGSLTQVPERSGAAVGDLRRDGTFSLNLLERIYGQDGQEGYDHQSLSAVMKALERFWDLPTIAEVYSVPRVAAQAMTIGVLD